MLLRLFVTAVVVFGVQAAFGADLGAPRLSGSLTADKFFDPARLLTTGGLKYEARENFSLEPEVGLGYEKREQELASGYAEVVHKLHARAGGKLNLSDGLFYLSAAAKLPLYTYGLADRNGGDLSYQPPLMRQDYDLFRRPGSNVGWSSEAGFHLGGRTEFNLFYDQTPLTGFQGGSRTDQTEERFGTRIIFRFK